MINKINLGFGNDRSFLKKEKILKIYNKGNIIISRPKSEKNNYQIISIKKYQTPQKIKKQKARKEEIKKIKKEKSIESEDDKRKNVGFILRKSFNDEEWENIIDFGPSSIKNRIKLNKERKKITDKKEKIKPYIPELKINEENEIDERYLRRTLNIYKGNEYLINKVKNIVNKIKINKDSNEELIDEKNNVKDCLNIIDNDYQNNLFINSDNLNPDNITNKIKDKNTKENKREFINIIDINKDKKYIEASKWIKNSKEDCEKMKEIIIGIDKKLKEDKKEKDSKEFMLKKNEDINMNNKAKNFIDEIKNNLDIYNFDINKLNKEDQKLLKGNKRYNPNERIKHTKNININKDKEPILISSINSIKELKKANENMDNIFKERNNLDKKEKDISNKWKNYNECVKAYLNNYKKGTKININEIREKKDINLENKNDIFNYIYMPKEYDEHWYNNQDTKDETEYKHPFLIYDD